MFLVNAVYDFQIRFSMHAFNE